MHRSAEDELMDWFTDTEVKEAVESLPEQFRMAVLLADVEGSTGLWETQPAVMASALAAMDGVIGELVPAHHGVCPVEQGEGDSFVLAFAAPGDAVACALAVQQAALAPLRLRIGVHTGEVQLRDEGKYMGPTVNRAARVRDLGHGGQILLSGATSRLVRQVLPDAARLCDCGSFPLRGMAVPERVAQLSHPDLRRTFPPLRAVSEG